MDHGTSAYHLGVDLGTTFTAAATMSDGRVDMVDLGNRATSMPSVVFVEPEGTYVVGESAERRGQTDPERLGREFKRRLGDPTPIVLGGVPCSADLLMAQLLAHAVTTATEKHGGPPASITVTHPASWGPYKLDLLAQAARIADCGPVELLAEPVAAVMHYAAEERVETGSVVAVYDFGGGTFDAAVVRKTDQGAELLGEPEGIESLGGVDFDQELLRLVYGQLGPEAATIDQNDPMTVAALARLREECRDAKEGLSMVDSVTVPVMLPGVQAAVEVTRADLEAVIASSIDHTVASLQSAVQSAGLGLADVHSVLLAGGSSRIPKVAELVGQSLGRPVSVDAHPKFVVAMGAALAGASRSGNAGGGTASAGAAGLASAAHAPEQLPDAPGAPTEPVPVVPLQAPTSSETAQGAVTAELPQTQPGDPAFAGPRPSQFTGPGAVPPPLSGPQDPDADVRGGFPWVLAVLAVLVFAGVVAGVVLLGNRDDDPVGEEAGETNGVIPGDDASNDPTPGEDPTPEDQPTPDEQPTPEPSPTETPFEAAPVQTVEVGQEPDTPVLFEGNLYVPNAGADTVTRIDVATAETTEITVGANPDTPLAAAGFLWVPARDSGSLARVDLTSLEVTSVDVGPRADTPTFAADHIWVTTREANELVVVDPDTMTVVQRATMGGRPLTPIVVDDQLWFVTRDDNSIHVVDLSSFDPDAPLVIDDIVVGTDPDRPVVANDRLWVPIRGEDRVQVIDPVSRQTIGTVPVGATPDTAVVAGGRLFVPALDAGDVTVIDTETLNVVATIDVGEGPKTGVEAAGSVWIPVSGDSVVAQISVADATLVETFLVGIDPETPAADDTSVWVPNAGSATVLELAVAREPG